VLVLGGGINGAVSAACRLARGARWPSSTGATSRASPASSRSNLAWGGIKYLETFEFGLVRKLCVSRNRLLRALPLDGAGDPLLRDPRAGLPPRPLEARAGHVALLAPRQLLHPPPRLLSLRDHGRRRARGAPRRRDGGFEYSDAYLHDNDARFVWGFVRGALDHGAAAANYVESLGATREGDRGSCACAT
jgi:glycerol-3-phosphate dehydrogenase